MRLWLFFDDAFTFSMIRCLTECFEIADALVNVGRPYTLRPNGKHTSILFWNDFDTTFVGEPKLEVRVQAFVSGLGHFPPS